MSAETLRRAAALMRERAEAATPGPWVSVNALHPGTPAEEVADQEHIASWHPAVAVAVADWLDVCADVMANDPSALKFNALLVAHAYLGDA